MKIAIFLPSLRGGGAERVMVTLANGFAERGHIVELVLASAVGPQLANVSSSVRVVDLNTGRVAKALIPLVHYIRQERPDALLSALGHANVVALLARMLARVKLRLVVSVRSTISVARKEERSGLAQTVTGWLSRLLYPRADAITCVSEAAAKDVEQHLGLVPGSVQTIYNPFDIEFIQRRAQEPLDHPWFQPSAPPVVLGVGRLVPAKDFATLIEAFARLRQQRRARLMILGEGPLRGELQALADSFGLEDDDFQMLGFVSNPYAYMSRCAVFVLSSRWEGLPGALIEAMICGAPIVSTDCPSGPREILASTRWSQLLGTQDIHSMAAAIAERMQRTDDVPPGVEARVFDFDQSHAVEAYLRVLLPVNRLPLRDRLKP